jgi:hypothetical protein
MRGQRICDRWKLFGKHGGVMAVITQTGAKRYPGPEIEYEVDEVVARKGAGRSVNFESHLCSSGRYSSAL